MANSKVRRSKTSSKCVYDALQLYSSGLSLRKTSGKLSALIRRNHVSIWNWIQRYRSERLFQFERTISEFIIDETLIKEGGDYVWLWVAIEPKPKGCRLIGRKLMNITWNIYPWNEAFYWGHFEDICHFIPVLETSHRWLKVVLPYIGNNIAYRDGLYLPRM